MYGTSDWFIHVLKGKEDCYTMLWYEIESGGEDGNLPK